MNTKYIKINFTFFILFYLIIMFIFSIISYNLFINNFIALEKKYNIINLNTVLSKINTKLEHIKNITNDYSKWDDSYEFILNDNKDYIYENFRDGTSTLNDLSIDFIIYVNLNKKIVFSKYKNDTLKKDKSNFENNILKSFNQKTLNTIIKYKSFVLYLVKSEIKNSDESKNSNAYIYTGKIISNKSLNALSNVFTKVLISDNNSKKNDLELNFSFLKNIKVEIIRTNSQIINNIKFYNNGNYIFSIISKNKREVYNSGQETIIIFNLIISIFLFIVLFLIFRNQKKLEHIVNVTSKDIILKQKIIAQQSKMVALGEIIENISHQWRQPLSIISTAASGILFQKKLGTLGDELLISSLQNIKNSTIYLSNTIDDFRNFLVKDDKVELCNLQSTIEKTISLINPIFTKHEINLINNIENIEIQAKENLIIQVLLNIFNNAIEALNINIKKDKKIICINISKKDKNIYISIKDNAGGIKRNIIEKVFEPYFTTKHKSQGTGIGLYMSYEIIKNHMKGEIIVKNSKFLLEGKNHVGAEFIIKLPC